MPIPLSFTKTINYKRKLDEKQIAERLNDIEKSLKDVGFEINNRNAAEIEFSKTQYSFFNRDFTDLISRGIVFMNTEDGNTLLKFKIFFSLISSIFYLLSTVFTLVFFLNPQTAPFRLLLQNTIILILLNVCIMTMCFGYPALEITKLIKN